MAIKVPRFRELIQVGGFPVDEIKPGMFSHERIVTFTVDGKQHGGWVPEHHLNEKRGLIEAWIIADLDEGWLIEIPPACEMISGQRFVLAPEEQSRFVPM